MGEVLDWSAPDIWRAWLSRDLAGELPDAESASRLRTRFAAIRSFHAARPAAPSSYYEKGIRPLLQAEWHALVEECFLSQAADPALVAAILAARDVQFDLIRAGRVHFCCDQRLLEMRDGYTLIYGTLSLLAVAIQLDKRFGTDFKAALRRRGDPVVFVCDVPTALFEDETLARLFGDLREAHERAGAAGALPSPFGFHYSIPHALPAAAIVGHVRPDRVVDSVYGHHIGG